MHPAQPSDPRPLLLPTSHGDIAVTDEGRGTAVIALHGIPGRIRDFRWLAPVLAPRLRVVRFDLPGYGMSGRRSPRALSIPDRASVVQQVMAQLALDDVTLVSHSAGAMVAAHLAVRDPRTTRCVLLAPPGPRPHFPRRAYTALYPALRTTTGRRLLAGPLRLVYRRMGFPSYLTDAERLHSVADAGQMDFDAYARDVRAAQTPTMVSYAADDRIIPIDRFESLAAVAPPGPRLVFPDGGHSIQKTRACELGEAIGSFILGKGVAGAGTTDEGTAGQGT